MLERAGELARAAYSGTRGKARDEEAEVVATVLANAVVDQGADAVARDLGAFFDDLKNATRRQLPSWDRTGSQSPETFTVLQERAIAVLAEARGKKLRKPNANIWIELVARHAAAETLEKHARVICTRRLLNFDRLVGLATSQHISSC